MTRFRFAASAAILSLMAGVFVASPVHAQGYAVPGTNSVYYPNPGYGYTPSYNPGYVGQYPGYYGQQQQGVYGQPGFTVPGSATAIGPSVNPVGQLGQQNTLQQPGNALQNAPAVRPPSVGSGQSQSQGTQRSARGMIIEGTATVIDGDTFTVDGRTVLLFGADAPEVDQTCYANGTAWRCGVRAKEELSRLIEGRQVSCVGQREAGEAVASICTVPTGDVGMQMVQSGLAVAQWELTKIYVNAQQDAKNSSRGVWAGSFEWPWDFRNKSGIVRVSR